MIVADFLAATVDHLAGGDQVNIRAFGVLETREYGAHTRRHPATREEIVVPAHTGIAFRPSPSMKRALNPPKPARKGRRR